MSVHASTSSPLSVLSQSGQPLSNFNPSGIQSGCPTPSSSDSTSSPPCKTTVCLISTLWPFKIPADSVPPASVSPSTLHLFRTSTSVTVQARSSRCPSYLQWSRPFRRSLPFDSVHEFTLTCQLPGVSLVSEPFQGVCST